MKRSKHSLSNYRIFTGDMGELIPINLIEVLPGDSIQQTSAALIRCSPLLSPVMHPVHVRIHHWYVPHRLTWAGTSAGDNWQDFITGGPDGLNAATFPTISSGAGFAIGTLWDYFGLPTSVASLSVNALPFRAYQLIYSEWYRDEDLTTKPTISLAGGVDSTTTTTLQNCAWEKDYFTSARPWAQKGPSVTLPLGSSATVKTNSSALLSGVQPIMLMKKAADGTLPPGNKSLHVDASGQAAWNDTAPGANATGWYPSNLYADLSSATATDIITFRRALALQRFEEARALYGSRYTEYLRYLGVKSSDARLQRPEYLGGGRQTIQFSEVLQTGVTTSGTPSTGVGSLLGHGIGSVRSNRYRRFFEEHGYIVSLMSVLPVTMYSQGVPKMWNRTTKEDFWQKELEHIGQETILNKEIRGNHALPTGIFGYQDRYDSYRRAESQIAGEFKTTLDYWHMARIFTSDPTLNSAFVVSNPTKRIFQSTSTDGLYVMVSNSVQARRLVAQKGNAFTF